MVSVARGDRTLLSQGGQWPPPLSSRNHVPHPLYAAVVQLK
ncbi:Uncharacterised protein [Vibrio cholerae]|nr:Uncharacterised protein [Vibrio cholerae]